MAERSARKRKVLRVDITWSKRVARVTSLTGGHTAKCLDLGDRMEIEIAQRPASRQPEAQVTSAAPTDIETRAWAENFLYPKVHPSGYSLVMEQNVREIVDFARKREAAAWLAALESACVAMCSMCQGIHGVKEVRRRVIQLGEGKSSILWWHGNDSNGSQCQAAAIRAIAAKEQR